MWPNWNSLVFVVQLNSSRVGSDHHRAEDVEIRMRHFRKTPTDGFRDYSASSVSQPKKSRSPSYKHNLILSDSKRERLSWIC